MRMIYVAAIIGLFGASPTLAQDKAPEFAASLKAEALKAFNNLEVTANVSIHNCHLAGDLILMQIRLGLPSRVGINFDCIQTGKSSVSAKYSEIRAKLAGDKDALLALNDYAASVLAVFDDLLPRDQEREREYASRIAAIETDLRRKASLVRLQLQ